MYKSPYPLFKKVEQNIGTSFEKNRLVKRIKIFYLEQLVLLHFLKKWSKILVPVLKKID
jgi:hypothetical protein